jgi:hypothetical protein
MNGHACACRARAGLPQAFAKHRLGDLAHGVLGRGLLDVYRARHLVAAREGRQSSISSRVRGCSQGAGHERHRLLTEGRVGLPDDRGLEYPGMGVQHIFDLLG